MSTTLTVTSTSWITPIVRRIALRTDDLSAFADSVFTDRYVKLAFPKPGVEYPQPLDVKALRGSIPPEDLPDVRTYTALFPDVAAGTLAIDFVVHGDEGIAGPWAARAEIGDTLVLDGPGGAYRPDPTADWHLIAGDESALPAIIAALEALDPDATARVVLQVQKPGYEPSLTLPRDARVSYVYREGGDRDGALLPAIRDLDWPAGRVHAFVHGEAHAVMHEVRPYLLEERGLPRADVSISGYWREGRDESGFREWKSQLSRAEAAAS
ncbi:siderophore-interacting protein [Microbacterium sp. SSM24]|uniref:siderophore-interacting protein n=1 Tax=Microbacterium sp. SSM24 TaxID=2991714 RepID=UPI0022266B36|nr:siderophore-interacting protein [Microbacterium sp. SSM24]MCW3492274.1 siderophore-interacting protein [Microbacterium sp. SSM24]